MPLTNPQFLEEKPVSYFHTIPFHQHIMKLSALLFAVIFSAVGAELHTGSKAGQRLLSKARQLENNNNQYY
jgi:hypothetical protein